MSAFGGELSIIIERSCSEGLEICAKFDALAVNYFFTKRQETICPETLILRSKELVSFFLSVEFLKPRQRCMHTCDSNVSLSHESIKCLPVKQATNTVYSYCANEHYWYLSRNRLWIIIYYYKIISLVFKQRNKHENVGR